MGSLSLITKELTQKRRVMNFLVLAFLANKGSSTPFDTTDLVADRDNQEVDECFVTMELNPVCGSDGVTYNNESELNCEKRKQPQLAVAYPGPCVDECFATMELNPVCGSDGVTYNNESELNCEKRKQPNLVVANQGQC